MVADNIVQIVIRVALRMKKGKIYKIQKISNNIYTSTISTHYTIVTNTIIISTYQLKSVRQYKSSCCQSGIKKEKRKGI